jgi:hypothetical protein
VLNLFEKWGPEGYKKPEDRFTWTLAWALNRNQTALRHLLQRGRRRGRIAGGRLTVWPWGGSSPAEGIPDITVWSAARDLQGIIEVKIDRATSLTRAQSKGYRSFLDKHDATAAARVFVAPEDYSSTPPGFIRVSMHEIEMRLDAPSRMVLREALDALKGAPVKLGQPDPQYRLWTLERWAFLLRLQLHLRSMKQVAKHEPRFSPLRADGAHDYYGFWVRREADTVAWIGFWTQADHRGAYLCLEPLCPENPLKSTGVDRMEIEGIVCFVPVSIVRRDGCALPREVADEMAPILARCLKKRSA